MIKTTSTMSSKFALEQQICSLEHQLRACRKVKPLPRPTSEILAVVVQGESSPCAAVADPSNNWAAPFESGGTQTVTLSVVSRAERWTDRVRTAWYVGHAARPFAIGETVDAVLDTSTVSDYRVSTEWGRSTIASQAFRF